MSFIPPQSGTEPTMLDEIAKLFNCAKRIVRSRLQSPEYHANAVAEFDQCILITTYKDRNGQHRTLIFEGLTQEGAHKIPAHGRLGYPFNSNLPQFFLDRHNIRLQYPFAPAVIYSPGQSAIANRIHQQQQQQNEYYPLELVRLLHKPMHFPPPHLPTSMPPSKPPRLPSNGSDDDDDDSTLTETSIGSTVSSMTSSRLSLLESIYAPEEDDHVDRQLQIDENADDGDQSIREQQEQPKEVESSAYATIEPDSVAYASVSMMDTPPQDARAYMCWEPDGKGKWSKKLVLVKEIPNYFFSSI